MDRRSLVVSAILVASVPIIAQQRDAPSTVDPLVLSDTDRQRQREADNIAAIASILSRIEQRQASAEQRRIDEEPKNAVQYMWKGLKTSTGSNYVLALFAAIAAGVSVYTLVGIKAQTRETARSAKAAEDAAQAAADTLATNREIERAYIAMSYRDLRFLERARMTTVRPEFHDDNPDTVDLVVELRNIGRTPGDIVSGWCGFLYQKAADKPKLTPTLDSSTHLTCLFMLPNQKPLDFAIQITLSKSKILFLRNGEPADELFRDGKPIPFEGKPMPVTDPMHLWLVGEIDYRDRFGTFHRVGYGMRWDRQADRFVWDPSVADLNYDRPLTNEEVGTRAYETGHA